MYGSWKMSNHGGGLYHEMRSLIGPNDSLKNIIIMVIIAEFLTDNVDDANVSNAFILSSMPRRLTLVKASRHILQLVLSC